MQDTMPHITDDSALDKRCRASVEASMRFFNVDLNLVSIQPETSLYSLISQHLEQAVKIFGLADISDILLQSATVEGMLNSIFDADIRPFVLKDCTSVLADIDEQDRASILAQAVAGVVVIVRKLALVAGADAPITTGVLARELLAFAKSQERKNVLGRIEHSRMFHACLMKVDLADLILAAIRQSDVHFESPVHELSVEDYKADGSRVASDNGLPWGFTIMAIN